MRGCERFGADTYTPMATYRQVIVVKLEPLGTSALDVSVAVCVTVCPWSKMLSNVCECEWVWSVPTAEPVFEPTTCPGPDACAALVDVAGPVAAWTVTPVGGDATDGLEMDAWLNCVFFILMVH